MGDAMAIGLGGGGVVGGSRKRRKAMEKKKERKSGEGGEGSRSRLRAVGRLGMQKERIRRVCRAYLENERRRPAS
jgi:hypothetical protein